jgi:hypothetical protein
MSGFQSPQLLTDLYRDLRDRRLLPLVLVLVVGLAVVPIALSSKSSSAPPASPPQAAVAKQSNAPPTQVVVSDPGLRDYRRRLAGDTPKDPFVQLFTAPSGDGTSGGESSAAGVSSAEAVGDAGAVSPGSSDATTAGDSTTVQTQVETDTKVVFYRLKVRTGQVGGEMKTRDEVGPSTQLPSKAVPVLAFLGANFNGDLEAQRAYFMVSNGVSTISGDGICSLGDPCQLLSLKPGQYADFVWTDGLTYRVKLLAFERHVRDQVPGEFGADGGSGGSGEGSSAAGAG